VAEGFRGSTAICRSSCGVVVWHHTKCYLLWSVWAVMLYVRVYVCMYVCICYM